MSESFISAASRQSHKAELQYKWNLMSMEAIEIAAAVDPLQTDLSPGVVIPAVDAVDWTNGFRNCDVRPRLLDKSSGKFRLIDSGSMITATVRLPGDKPDPSSRLIAVNGSQINTYGVRELSVKIGRKEYNIQAVIYYVNLERHTSHSNFITISLSS